MPQVCKSENTREEDTIEEEETPLIIAGFGNFGVVLGRFLIANGMSATILDDNPENIDVLRKFGFKVYYGDSTRADLLASAGADKAKVLIVTVDDPQKSLKIIDQARRNYPHLKILARAVSMKHSYELLDRKVDGFERDMLESSLLLGIEALTHLGYKRYHAHRLAHTFRKHVRKVLLELHKHHKDDEKMYLSETKRHAQELEELFRVEKEDRGYDLDSSWDVSSRREEAEKIIRSDPEVSN